LKWRSKCGRYTVSISQHCFKKINEIAKKYYPKEVGTSLIGYYTDDGFDAFIVDIAFLPLDLKTSNSFLCRGVKGFKAFFIELWKKSKGKIHYIGEWHSHPNASSEPSSIDNKSQSEIANDRKTNCPINILAIIGGSIFESPTIRIFIYTRKQGRINLFQDEQ
jgi:integrative and conjugative element protein (TIGR02256 family)